MNNPKSRYDELLEEMSDWVRQSVRQDVLTLMEIKRRARQYLQAAEDLSKEEMEALENTLTRDLDTFVAHWQRDADRSPWWQATKDKLWSLLADASDKSQLAMSESMRDVQHQGIYKAGEQVALGELECTRCHNRHQVLHVETIQPCLECGHNRFSRVL
ncbi:zinc ribbon-containing protein [Bowmanella dokdonensis]|uniref:Zinc ribbon-containing protein n=1 Tax=Bowmanella dokdonensis TaxID=751969 RepID=A0A939DMV5_9ALTE|nr:hypothetical protein [Bowmanella dokdonensis]MBN7824706.1 hypothetical protein [Bowmanella dokdonensis]